MTKEKSLEEHNRTQYDLYNDIEYWRKHNELHQTDAVFNNRELRLGDLLNKYPTVRKCAIDIGSGVGWLSAILAANFMEVISIEPSAKALAIAKSLYKNINNIRWVVGFAEDYLEDIFIYSKDPILFTTCSVFQHLDDDIVIKILKIINDKAPVGSIIGFQELWGNEVSKEMHHVRTSHWWEAHLMNWHLDFHGPQVMENTNKGIHGVKYIYV